MSHLSLIQELITGGVSPWAMQGNHLSCGPPSFSRIVFNYLGIALLNHNPFARHINHFIICFKRTPSPLLNKVEKWDNQLKSQQRISTIWVQVLLIPLIYFNTDMWNLIVIFLQSSWKFTLLILPEIIVLPFLF